MRRAILVIAALFALSGGSWWEGNVANAGLRDFQVGDGGSVLGPCNDANIGATANGVAGHNWLCILGSPDHWIITG